MRFVTNMSKGILGAPDSSEMWTNIVSRIPDEVLLKPDVKILNVAYGHGTEALIIARRMLALGRTKEDVRDSMYLLDKYNVFRYPMEQVGFTNIITADFMTWETDMKFDVVVGNPPYQDGSQDGGQNKIYNQFSKKALDLSSRYVAFVTPTSVLKKSKRFSLIGMHGLQYVDFTANNYFTVGATICSWIVDKNYTNSTVSVLSDTGEDTQQSNKPIYDHSIVDADFAAIYNGLKKATKSPSARMFKHNSVDATNGRSKEPADGFDYPVYAINSDLTLSIVQYNKPKPKLHGLMKLVVPISKAFKEDICVESDLDFDAKQVAVPFKDAIELANIKSFIFSDTFKEHVQKWKDLDGYGWNYAIMYLPYFDTSKTWTNEEVKEFLESFRNGVNVIYDTGSHVQDVNDPIYDLSVVDADFAKIYVKLKSLTESPESRMFRQNNHGPAFSKTQLTPEHIHRVHKLIKGVPVETYWTTRKPHAQGKLKLSIGMTKALSNESLYVGTEDFDVGYMTIAVDSITEAENIKSFLLTDAFTTHSEKWKQLDGYGYNYALKYLPPFDTSKTWTNEEVKEFLESFLNA